MSNQSSRERDEPKMASRIRFFALGAAIAIAAMLYMPVTYYLVRAAVGEPSPLLASQVWFMTMDLGILIFMLRNKGRPWLSGVWRHWFRYFAVWVLLGFASIEVCSKFAPLPPTCCERLWSVTSPHPRTWPCS